MQRPGAERFGLIFFALAVCNLDTKAAGRSKGRTALPINGYLEGPLLSSNKTTTLAAIPTRSSVNEEGHPLTIDTGFLVNNEVTYPNLTRLLASSAETGILRLQRSRNDAIF